MPEQVIAIGEPEQVRGFRSAGVQIAPVKSSSEALQTLQLHARDREVVLILITETVAAQLGHALAELRQRSHAMILVVPPHQEGRHASLLEMKSLIEHSIGVDLIGKIEG